VSTGPAIVDNPLPYVDKLQQRSLSAISLVVIHCTELPDLQTAREYGLKIHHAGTGTGNSGHYYIDRDGRIERWVPHRRVAHHVRGFNQHSLGIELVNLGRYPEWLSSRSQEMSEPYPAAQMDALCALLRKLCRTIASLKSIAGHEDLDTGQVPASDDPSRRVYRKRDPGTLFPWPELLGAVPLQRLDR
jgi:N-acetylmuramoyl-L-alanine amidase